MLSDELARYSNVVSMEEGFSGRGGLDAMLSSFLRDRSIDTGFAAIGVQGGYRFELGSRIELHEQVGIGPDAVARRLLEIHGGGATARSASGAGV